MGKKRKWRRAATFSYVIGKVDECQEYYKVHKIRAESGSKRRLAFSLRMSSELGSWLDAV